MEGQARKLMLTLAIVVKGPDHLDTIVPGVRALAGRHVAYDARREYWDQASIWMLEQGMGHAFTPVVEASWIATYSTLSDAVIEAAHG